MPSSDKREQRIRSGGKLLQTPETLAVRDRYSPPHPEQSLHQIAFHAKPSRLALNDHGQRCRLSSRLPRAGSPSYTCHTTSIRAASDRRRRRGCATGAHSSLSAAGRGLVPLGSRFPLMSPLGRAASTAIGDFLQFCHRCFLTRIWMCSGSIRSHRTKQAGRNQSPASRAKTTTPFAGITIEADVGRPCIGGPEAEIAPRLPATIGLTKLS